MADSHPAARAADAGLVTEIATLFLVGFGIEPAVFRLLFWRPAAEPRAGHVPAVAASAVFANLPTEVGDHAMDPPVAAGPHAGHRIL